MVLLLQSHFDDKYKSFAAPLPTLDDLLVKNGLMLFRSLLRQFADVKKILDSNATKYTVFAPTNAAFFEMEAVDRVKSFRDRSYLKRILRHHIVPRKFKIAKLRYKESTTMAGYVAFIQAFAEVFLYSLLV